MAIDHMELGLPNPQPILTAEEILLGPPVAPEQRVRLYSDEEFETFIEEWAYFFLSVPSNQYVKVGRFGGAGDAGRDVVGYLEWPIAKSRFDIFQCKRYSAPLAPSDIWTELGKLCVYTFMGAYPVPRSYYFVAPQDIGPSLTLLLENPQRLREGLIEAWTKYCEKKIAKDETYVLGSGLSEHIDAFPFEIITYKPIMEVIEEFRRTPRYAARFGGGLKPYPTTDVVPPMDVDPQEIRYVEHLLSAYAEADGMDVMTLPEALLCTHSGDLARQRVRFYSAETLRRFSRDVDPSDEAFKSLLEQMHLGVVDIVDSDHSNALQRLRATMAAAAQVNIGTAHMLARYLKAQSQQGMCHQLANEDRLIWRKKNNQ